MPHDPGMLSSPCPAQLKKGGEQKSLACKMELSSVFTKPALLLFSL